MLARFLVLLTTLLTCHSLSAQPVDFGRDVYVVLQRACFECHGSDRQEADLRLDRRADFLTAQTVVPGDPENSELLRRILLPASHDELMPAVGDPLPRHEIAAIRRWIQSGAAWPHGFEPPKHWAYEAPTRPPLPDVGPGATAGHPIDRIVQQQLERRGLKASPAADPPTLLRRVYLDLIGLPPTPAEVDAFVADPSEAAWQAVVDDLLNRPQFGERWARPWLDLARYADSHGFQRDNLRQVWAYRDWVIQALNADMPFDRFTIEQIAGDLLPNATVQQRIATGFHRCTPTNVEAGSLPEETRIEQVLDRVNTTAAVWLGSTLECAQCHDHKYDPFSQREYYQLLAFFNNTEREADRANPKSPSSIKFLGPRMEVSNPRKEAQRAKLEQQLRDLQAKSKHRKQSLAASLPVWIDTLKESAIAGPAEHVLTIKTFQSTEPASAVRMLPDGSVLLAQPMPPDRDTYVVTCETRLPDIAAIRLETLTHEALPGGGPGRGDPVRRNFVLNEFHCSVNKQPQNFTKATADFSQTGWSVQNLISGGKGWAIAPQFDKAHWGLFEFPMVLPAGRKQLTFRLVQNYGGGRTIGRLRLSAVCGNLTIPPVPAKMRSVVLRKPDQWTSSERQRVIDYQAAHDDQLLKLQNQIDAIQAKLKTIEPDTTLVMKELPEARPAYVFERGDYRSRGKSVQAATPSILHPLAERGRDRLALARWLVDPANPLTARVTVNRWWAELFGRGLVATAEDFGVKGDRPTHPKLLDWLAVELVENNWSMKHVLKQIVHSATYRQSSFATAEQREADPDNRWLARGARFRMSAEMIRDNALAISGLLSEKQFGPSIRPFQPDGVWSKVGGEAYQYKVSDGEDAWRRGIYVVLKRGAPYPSFVNFDATARLACTVQRSRTNTPLQALTLMNDPVYVEAAAALARLMLQFDSRDDSARLTYGFRRSTGRPPTATELSLLTDLLQKERGRQPRSSANADKASGPSLAAAHRPAEVSESEFSAWQAISTVLMNLHETITKN